MPIVSPHIHTLVQMNSNGISTGKQTLDGQEVPQRGAEIRRIVQRKGPVSREPPTSSFRFLPPISKLNVRIVSPFRQYQLALYQIDSLRVDGKFTGADGAIPEGQGIVMAHLNECHELVEMVYSSSRFSSCSHI